MWKTLWKRGLLHRTNPRQSGRSSGLHHCGAEALRAHQGGTLYCKPARCPEGRCDAAPERDGIEEMIRRYPRIVVTGMSIAIASIGVTSAVHAGRLVAPHRHQSAANIRNPVAPTPASIEQG